MDTITIISIALQIIGGATVLLNMIAPLTKNKTDDKILAILNKVLEVISMNRSEGTVKIKLKR